MYSELTLLSPFVTVTSRFQPGFGPASKSMYVCVCVCIHMCVYLCVCECMHVCRHVCTCVYVNVCVYVQKLNHKYHFLKSHLFYFLRQSLPLGFGALHLDWLTS